MAPGLNIIGRLRPRAFEGRRVVAVRWALDAGTPFPVGGFQLSRTLNGVVVRIAVDLRLPGASKAVDGSWSIDPGKLERDRLVRRKPFDGATRIPDLPSAATAETLLPLLTFCLPEASGDACEAQFAAVADSFANAHETDLELGAQVWNMQTPPQLPKLIAMRSGNPNERKVYETVVRFYQRTSLAFITQLANEFGMAKLVGLGFDDLLEDPIDPVAAEATPQYAVAADPIGPATQARMRGLADSYALAPRSVRPLIAKTLLGYPGFGPFYRGPRGWTAVPPAATPPQLMELSVEAAKGRRHYPATAARLCWLRPRLEGDGARAALNFEAMRWRVERHRFPRTTAMDDARPAMPSFFRPCRDATAIEAKPFNSWVDDTVIPWGDLPFEGWHAYRVRAVDIFGIDGNASSTLVRFRDEIGPPPPTFRRDGHRVEIHSGTVTTLDLQLDWGAAQELAAPDAVEFRLRQEWVSISHFLIQVTETSAAPHSVDALEVDAHVLDCDGSMLDQKALEHFVGGVLMAENGEFPVLAVSPPNKEWPAPALRVRRALHDGPARGGAAIRYVAPPRPGGVAVDPTTSARRPALSAAVTLQTLDPLKLKLAAPRSPHEPLPPQRGRVHLVLLDSNFDAAPGAGAGEFILTLANDRPEERLAFDRLASLRQMTLVDAGALLDGSPAIFLPPHPTRLDLAPPDGFISGTLEVRASAADAAPYQGAPGRPGNEGPASSAFFTAFCLDPPEPIKLKIVPKVWARGAAEYVETAQAAIHWPPVSGVLCYEVERALESALDLPAGGSDEDVLAQADRIGDRCFERRTSMAYGSRWIDDLPGRAPSRAVYRVRPVTAAGVAGPWTIVMLVRVPDVRVPSPPNVMQVGAPESEDRLIALRWSQPSPIAGIGFKIEVRPCLPALDPEEGWIEEAVFLPGQLMEDADGGYSVHLPDQQPGALREFRVVAIRHALDPLDPRAKLNREIRGRASVVNRAAATGELRPPTGLEARLTSGVVELRWINGDTYDRIEVRRRRPGGYGFERFEVQGGAHRFVEDAPLSAGAWTYELAGITAARRVISARVTIELP